jgi:lysozyme
MRSTVVAWTSCLALFVASASNGTASSGGSDQPPQLLGVWYGEYELPTEAGVHPAEMWIGVYWQLSQDGWDIRGHKRWNVLDQPDEKKKGRASRGREFEHFDSFSGRIGRDGKTVAIDEDHGPGGIEAILRAEGVLDATFRSHHGASSPVTVRLTRIDTHYEPSEAHVLGVDVSHHSGRIDWKQVHAQGYLFAYVKSSEGVDNPDAMFETHWRALRELGMPRGAYHFYVTEDDPVEQARFFASRLREDPGTLPPAVDVEVLGAHTTGDMSATLLRFLKTLEAELGIRPVIYTSTDFWDGRYQPAFSDYPLWMAEYGVVMPKVPFGWKSWLFWQRVENKAVKGIENSADINLLHPDVDLQSLLTKE